MKFENKHFGNGFKRLLILILTATLSLLTVTAFAETPQRGDVLKIRTIGLDTSDIHRHTGSIGVPQVFAECLTSISDDGQPKPWLSKGWEISPDGLRYTFQLRQGVKFHNGREMTAEDVMANFSRVKNEVSKGWLASAMKQVEGFEAPGKYTFVVRMSKPYAAFLNLISELWIMAPESPGWNETITKPIGTGPFTFGEWIPQVKLVAPKNENYWMTGKPYLDGLEFDLREEGDPSLALRAGDLHIARVKGSKIPILEKDPNIELLPMKDTGWYFWSFNNRSPQPPFDNVRIREAVTYALDKKAYMNFISKKGSLVTNQMVVPGNFFFKPFMLPTNTKNRI